MIDMSLDELFGEPIAFDIESAPRQTAKVLRPVRPNAGLTALYRAKLDALIREMNDSVLYWLKSAYANNEPEVRQIATDESPAAALKAAIGKLARRWLKRFDEAAPKLASWFAQKASDRSDAQLKQILKEGGFAIEFKLTAAQQDILSATVNQNVALIKSIPRQYFTQIEGMVQRSVQMGGDIGGLAKEIESQFGVTKRRAQLIAKSQNSMATASLTRARQLNAGITEAIWRHSGGGREPRPTHVAAGAARTRYNVAEGWFDPAEGKYIHPGQLINCRCVSIPVVKGFTK